MADASATTLPLEGFPLVILVVSVVCLSLSTIAVGLRTYLRLKDRVFGWDDGLILIGWGTKYLMLWMMLYVLGLAIIKSSVCVTLYRIASTQKVYKIAVLSLLGLTICTFLVTFIGILLLCHPVAANWDTSLIAAGKGKCSGMDAMIGLSYTSTGSTILTDMACAVFPGIMLYRTQMPLARKISVGLLLSFASVASISTMIRAPYIEHYRTPTDNLLYYTGFIVMWSNIETAIGCVASSIPTLRRFVVSKKSKDESSSNPQDLNPKGLATFGSAPAVPRHSAKGRGVFRNPTDAGLTYVSVHAHGDGDWKRLRDGDSDHSTGVETTKGIRTDYTFEVELSKSPQHVKSEFV
ncbi:hypothetical protein BP5796_04012 [Coleophoma crateriformis]|uniref:Rhodopsin domain-containing protein n=1 Tax=Coleophoma crateriformis TaxID=565419 RepID=A0A3D8SH61_9HELO|nr:hypothetical protein BP5796_04012 [Coleophoma crateriformis]